MKWVTEVEGAIKITSDAAEAAGKITADGGATAPVQQAAHALQVELFGNCLLFESELFTVSPEPT